MGKSFRWVTVKGIDLCMHLIPQEPGCYAIYCDGEIVYIGETENLRARLSNGHELRGREYSAWVVTPWGSFKSVDVKFRLCRRFGQWAMIERRLIRRLQPKFNRRGVQASTVACGGACA